MLKYEINKEIVFSSAHITLTDNLRLTDGIDVDGICVTNLEGGVGYRIILDKNELELSQMSKNNLSDSFANLVQVAIANDCNILVIDGDGSQYRWLTSYQW